ncbi:MAG: DNA-binding response regulator [Alteromonas sp.]|nr:DNA-binding response regulator [Alteromonas sp.]MAY22073.1 DNA-binding response regulator [Flavobacteriaceae bacterium]|tara:strand:+ start:8391 stop:9059 length:669 start_codon:yes stop_codon:yes gene_type:complete
MTITIVLADDEELFRVGMSHILSRDEEIQILFEAENGKELLHFLETATKLPDIIIMDIKMPELNGVEATKAIATQYPEINIIALTTYNTKPFIRNMIDVGASAYLVKNSPTQKVLHTIKQVYYHGFYYDNLVMEALKGTHNGSKLDKRTVFDEDFITQREKEVLEQICLQKTSQEIAEALFISKRTVEVHRKNLLEKTGAKNIAGLVIFAIQNNLVSPIIIE